LACHSHPLFLRIPNQLFLLAIDGNDQLSFGFKSFADAIDVPKLAIPVGMQFTLNTLLGGLRKNVSIPPVYHIPLDTFFQCVSRDGNSKSCTGIQLWLLSFHVGKQVSNKTSVYCEGDIGHLLILSNRATK
jgi:hypothetical protein